MPVTAHTHPDACYVWICWTFIVVSGIVMYNACVHFLIVSFAAYVAIDGRGYDRWLDRSAHEQLWHYDR